VGASLPFENIGIVDNRGLELALMHRNNLGPVGYSIGGNITYAKNRIVDVDEPADVHPNLRRTGRPIGQYFGYQAIGLFQEGEVTDAPRQPNEVSPGDIRYADTNGDGVITPDDRVPIGRSTIPEIIYGINAGLTFKGFDLNVLFQGAGRVSAYVGHEAAWAFYNSGKALERHLDRWTPENPGASYPRLTSAPTANNTEFSSYWLEDASYLRLKNVELGYTVPNALISRLRMTSMRVFVSGQNLLTITGLQGIDPEGPGAGGNSARGWFYPQMRVFAGGVNFNF
jgi:hypothetical protein